ncbi:hypothetical protein AB1Y20_006196 [Prymnesium parvum]|uniref:DAGKc domain-containing protein n=1 Tax=Prymnesium parvum TaxID=97485 RepID=A0AB34J3G8_PRYPA
MASEGLLEEEAGEAAVGLRDGKLGAWPLEEILRVEPDGASLLVHRCGRTQGATPRDPKPFRSADPRPRRLTRHTIRLAGAAEAAELAHRVSAALLAAFPPRRLLCVINPRAGGLRGVQLFASRAQPVLEAAGAQLDVRVTCSPGDATRWVHDAPLDAFDGVAVVGGDGTLNEAIEGLTTRPDAKRACAKLAFAHLGGGTANAIMHNIAMECDEASDMVTAAFLAVHGQPRAVDAARAWATNGRSRPLVLSVMWGLISDIDQESEWLRCCCPWPCGCSRVEPYICLRVCCLRRYDAVIDYLPADAPPPPDEEFYGQAGNYPKSALLPADASSYPPPGWKRFEGSINLLFAGNAAWADPDFPMAPDARLSDGAISLIVTHGSGACGLLGMMLKLLEGEHTSEHQHVLAERVRAFRIAPARGAPSAIGIDGEYISRVVDADGVTTALPVEVVSYPATLRLFMGAQRAPAVEPIAMSRS